MAPKTQSAASRPLPPPPVPVTQRPMYLSQPPGGGFGGPRRSNVPHPAALANSYGVNSGAGAAWADAQGREVHSNLSYHSQPPPSGAAAAGGGGVSSAAAQAAIAAAQAIAARLAAQAPPGG